MLLRLSNRNRPISDNHDHNITTAGDFDCLFNNVLKLPAIFVVDKLPVRTNFELYYTTYRLSLLDVCNIGLQGKST